MGFSLCSVGKEVRRSATDEGDAAGGDVHGYDGGRAGRVREQPARGRRTTRPAPCRCPARPPWCAWSDVAELRSSAVPCPSPPRTIRETSGWTISASSRAVSPPLARVVAVTVSAPAGSTPSRVTGRIAPGAGESPWAPTAPERTVAELPVAGAERGHRGAAAAQVDHGQDQRIAGAQRDRRSRCPRRRARHSRCRRTSDSPVQVDVRRHGRGAAGRARLSSAWRYCTPHDLLHRRGHRDLLRPRDRRPARASSAARGSWTPRPSCGSPCRPAATPSKVTPVAGRRSAPGGVRAEEPRGHDPGDPAPAADAPVASRFCTRESTP